MSMSRRSLPALSAIVLITFFGLPLLAQKLSNHYAVVLSEPAVADRFPTREATRSVAARDYQRQIELRQESLKTELATRRFNVVGSVSTLSNAVFVVSTADRVKEIEALPGVLAVIPMRPMRMRMNRAVQLMNAPAAWNLIPGGMNQAGAGIKIAILDSRSEERRVGKECRS